MRQPPAIWHAAVLIAVACNRSDETGDDADSSDSSSVDSDSATDPGPDADGDGMTTEEGDCDDTDATIYLHAPEVVGDGIDQNCDLSDAGPCIDLGDADALLVGAPQYFGAGWNVVAVPDISGDGRADLLVSAPDYREDGKYPKRTATVYLVTDPLQGEVDLAEATAEFADGEEIYDRMTAADVDGDEATDILIGAPYATPTLLGAVFWWPGPLEGSYEAGDRYSLLGVEAGDRCGYGLTSGDLDGDGQADVVVACEEHDSTEQKGGRVAVLRGPIVPEDTVASADAVLHGDEGPVELGYEMAVVGDVDGDGYQDLGVGAIYGVEGRGTFDLVFGPIVEGDSFLADASSRWIGPDAGDAHAGYSIAPAGDLDSDGRADVLVSAPMADDAFGKRSGKAYLLDEFEEGTHELSEAPVHFDAEAAYEWMGGAVSSAGDFDGDGLGDVAISAPRQFGGGAPEAAGKVYLFRGPFDGPRSGAQADLVLDGERLGDAAGFALLGGLDLNGDGLGDLVIGAPDADYGGLRSSGVVYVVHGFEL